MSRLCNLDVVSSGSRTEHTEQRVENIAGRLLKVVTHLIG